MSKIFKNNQPKTSHPPARSKRPAHEAAGASDGSGGLFIIATPIGNSQDITLRALEALRSCDIIAAEDTRHTGQLLARHAIKRPMMAYHEHNAEKMRPQMIRRMQDGGKIALVSDAGTPLVSDPGYKLVAACRSAGLPVTALPGPSATINALVLSGQPSDRFFHAGFLSPKQSARREDLRALASIPATMIFFESPNRLAQTLADMADILGNRPATVLREMTKLFEEARPAPLSELARHYEKEGAPKGEVVIVVAGPGKPPPASSQDIDALLKKAMENMSARDAARDIANLCGIPRREAYARALSLMKKEGR